MRTNLLEKNIPKGWQQKQIKDLLDYERPDKYIVESDRYLNQGTPVLTANKSFILGYTDEKTGIYENVPVIIFDDFTTDSKFVDFPFKVKSSAIKILKDKEGVDLRFVYEKMKSINFPTGSHKRYYISQYQSMEVAVPPLPEQKKIAEILTTVDGEIQKTDEIISATEKLKRGLMQQLFTRGIGHTKFKNTEIGEIPVEWGLSKLQDVAKFTNGKAHEKDIKEDGKYIVINSKFISTNGEVIKRSDKNLSPLVVGDVAMVMSDIPKGKALAKCFLVEENNKYTLNQRICSLRATKMVDKFLYYILNRNPYFLGFDNGVGQTNLRKDEVLNCPLQIPPESEQRKIVELLSSLDEKIAVNKKLKAELTILKKGLMQDLLSGKKRTI